MENTEHADKELQNKAVDASIQLTRDRVKMNQKVASIDQARNDEELKFMEVNHLKW